jgi:hypothetical protein
MDETAPTVAVKAVGQQRSLKQRSYRARLTAAAAAAAAPVTATKVLQVTSVMVATPKADQMARYQQLLCTTTRKVTVARLISRAGYKLVLQTSVQLLLEILSQPKQGGLLLMLWLQISWHAAAGVVAFLEMNL